MSNPSSHSQFSQTIEHGHKDENIFTHEKPDKTGSMSTNFPFFLNPSLPHSTLHPCFHRFLPPICYRRLRERRREPTLKYGP